VTDPALAFEQELEVLRTEAEGAAQFFYSYLAIHAAAGDHKKVHRLLNGSALLWNTILSGLQTSTFIVLGRILDQNSAHNVDRVLKIAQNHPEIFSRSALGKRKQGNLATPPDWLSAYLSGAYVPKAADFRRLRAYVGKQRKIYNTNYRELRHKVFAHKELTDPAAVSALFAKTNIRELQQLIVFFSRLYNALWELFFNGRKPTLRARRYSLRAMRDRPSPPEISRSVHERIAHEVERFLVTAAGAAQQRIAGDAPKTARV